MIATARASLTVVVALATSGCFGQSYGARRAPLGEPASPSTRVEAVDTFESYTVPGFTDKDGGSYRAVMTRDGLVNQRDAPNVLSAMVLDVRLDGGAGVDVVAMMWSPPTAPRCEGGHPALDILLDRAVPPDSVLAPHRQVHWERPVVVRGERVISGRFDEDPGLLMRASVIDVQLVEHEGGVDRGVCVRVPATGPDVAYWNHRRWSFGLRVSVRSALAFTSSSTSTLGLSLGRWLGPVRLGVEGFVGGTDRPDGNGPRGTGLCFAAAGPDCDGVDLGGFGVEASGIAKRWRTRWALGWSVGYEAFFAEMGRLDPMSPNGALLSRRASAGAPRLGLQLLSAVPSVAGVAPTSPTDAWGVELFVEAPHEWSGAALGSRIDVGVSVLTF
ncbi:MAG: hypothetical protein JWM82_2941 [Myxococcales bacterium]|nr:hypothetical protein [Myxococcales bacterium]